MVVTGLKKPIWRPSELACERFLLSLRRNMDVSRGEERSRPATTDVSRRETFAGHLELETGLSFTFYELKSDFFNISSEKLMLYFRLVVALYTYTQC